jgi:hypothetical protein
MSEPEMKTRMDLARNLHVYVGEAWPSSRDDGRLNVELMLSSLDSSKEMLV